MVLLEHDIDDALADLRTFPRFEAFDPIRQHVLTVCGSISGPRGSASSSG